MSQKTKDFLRLMDNFKINNYLILWSENREFVLCILRSPVTKTIFYTRTILATDEVSMWAGNQEDFTRVLHDLINKNGIIFPSQQPPDQPL